MKAIAVVPGVRDSLTAIETADPRLGAHDVLVKVTRVGICGTDLELKDGLYGKAPPGSDYLVIGHEALGQIAEIGPEVRDFALGDHVVASVRRPCPHRSCVPCLSEQNDMCVTGDYRERGINGQHGFLSEYYSEHEQWLTKIPAETESLGNLLEPISVVEKAMRQTFKIQERLPWNLENAIVLGAGPIGLLSAMLLRLKGINTWVLDRSDEEGVKSQLIALLGARHVDTRQSSLSEVAAEAGRVDFVMEATGYTPLVFEAARHLAPDGLLCMLGVSGGNRQIPVDANEFNNKLVLGNRLLFGSVNASLVDFRSGVDRLGQINQRWPGALETMITRRTPLQEFQAAFDRTPEDIKVVIELSEYREAAVKPDE